MTKYSKPIHNNLFTLKAVKQIWKNEALEELEAGEIPSQAPPHTPPQPPSYDPPPPPPALLLSETFPFPSDNLAPKPFSGEHHITRDKTNKSRKYVIARQFSTKYSATDIKLRPERRAQLSKLRMKLGVDVDDGLLDLALTHSSYSARNNERLEFLGDAVIDMIVSEDLFRRYPECKEGDLTTFRSMVVNKYALHEVSKHLDLVAYINIDSSNEINSTTLRENPNVASDSVEALIGAIYISQGFQVCKNFVSGLFAPMVASVSEQYKLKGSGNFKGLLQTLIASRDPTLPFPVYEVTSEDPSSNGQAGFKAQVFLGSKCIGTGTGKNKKIATNSAAEDAYTAMTRSH